MPSACPEKSRGAPTGAVSVTGDTTETVADEVVVDGASLEEREDEGEDAVEATSSHGGKGRFSIGVVASSAASDAAHSI